MVMSATRRLLPSPYYSAAPVGNSAAFTNSVLLVKDSITQRVTAFVTFALGSLTNATVQPQLSYDGTNWFDVTSPGPRVMSASGQYSIPIDGTGARVARLKVTSSGDATGSTIAVDFAAQTLMLTG